MDVWVAPATFYALDHFLGFPKEVGNPASAEFIRVANPHIIPSFLPASSPNTLPATVVEVFCSTTFQLPQDEERADLCHDSTHSCGTVCNPMCTRGL